LADVKIYLSEELEEQFKRRSMETYGYGRGSISKAGAEAIQRWTSERDAITSEYRLTKEPVRRFRGLLKQLRTTSVGLQHEERRIRSKKSLGAR